MELSGSCKVTFVEDFQNWKRTTFNVIDESELNYPMPNVKQSGIRTDPPLGFVAYSKGLYLGTRDDTVRLPNNTQALHLSALTLPSQNINKLNNCKLECKQCEEATTTG